MARTRKDANENRVVKGGEERTEANKEKIGGKKREIRWEVWRGNEDKRPVRWGWKVKEGDFFFQVTLFPNLTFRERRAIFSFKFLQRREGGTKCVFSAIESRRRERFDQ